jgi:hypothetical protein
LLSDKEKEWLMEILLILMSEMDLQLLANSVTENMILPLTTAGKLMSEDILKWMSMLMKTI